MHQADFLALRSKASELAERLREIRIGLERLAQRSEGRVRSGQAAFAWNFARQRGLVQ
ncbi:MAG: hypothetical protein JWO67_4085 [Streptosporangiaceae bacterium]|nr:hypothetical protein [Streptosporangiaceae bacterium]